MATLRVVFIDDGIAPAVIPAGISFDAYIAGEQGVVVAQPSAAWPPASHATMCYSQFLKRVTVPYHLISIQALGEGTGTGHHEALVHALAWCGTQDIALISLSMGTRQYSDFAPIMAQVEALAQRGVIMVAACSNHNTLTLPACLPQVIGVRHCPRAVLPTGHAYLPHAHDQIEVMTCAGDMQGGANSRATPLISAQVLRYIHEGAQTPAAIRERLAADATPVTLDDAFYKGLLHDWEDIGVPAVAVPPHACKRKLAELLRVFVADGYQAIALSTTLATCVQDLIFRLDTAKPLNPQIDLLYNFALPDILFYHADLATLQALDERRRADIVLNELEWKQDAATLFHTLERALS